MENDVKQTHHTNDNPASSKRKLLLGLAAAPVAATLPTRFAWGRGNECSISGLLSGNLSDQPTDYECRNRTGKSPGFWGTHPGCWPMSVSFGVIEATPDGSAAGIQISDGSCIQSKFLMNNGHLVNAPVSAVKYNYHFTGTDAHSLDDVINSVIPGSVSGWTAPIMDYFPPNDQTSLGSRAGDTFAWHVAAAMLTALHPNGNYPYTPTELVNAIVFAIANGKTAELTSILFNLQDGSGTTDAPGLIVPARRC